MPLTTLYALIALQYGIVGGLMCFLSAWHTSMPELQQLPMVQRRLRKLSARRQRYLAFYAIYVRVVFWVFGMATLVALSFAGFAFYQSVVTPNPQLVTPAIMDDIVSVQIVAVALQIFLLVGVFVQLVRARRVQRAMALEELAALGATGITGRADAPAGS